MQLTNYLMLMAENFSRVIEEVYSHIDRTNGWEHILSTLTCLTGSSSGCVVSAHSQYPNSNVGVFYNIDPVWIEAYNDYYYQYDPTPALLRSNPGKVKVDHVSGQRLSDAPEANKTFYHEVMRPQSFRHTLALGLSSDNQWNAGLILQRSDSQHHYSTADIRRIESISGHLSQALQLHTRLSQANGLQTSMAAAITHSPVAVILLDQRGRFVHANPLAEQLLSGKYPVDIKNGTLVANNDHDNILLHKLLHKTISAKIHHQNYRGGGKMKIDNILQVNVCPISESDSRLFTIRSNASVAVWLSPCMHSSTLTPELLREQYDLTPTEAEILNLMVKGKSLSEISTIRSVKFETIRSQLKIIKNKFGVSRQAELVRHILDNARSL